VCEHWCRLGKDWRHHFSASEHQNPATVYVAPRRGFDFRIIQAPRPARLPQSRTQQKGFSWARRASKK
jgi:hypothetical protein